MLIMLALGEWKEEVCLAGQEILALAGDSHTEKCKDLCVLSGSSSSWTEKTTGRCELQWHSC